MNTCSGVFYFIPHSLGQPPFSLSTSNLSSCPLDLFCNSSPGYLPPCHKRCSHEKHGGENYLVVPGQKFRQKNVEIIPSVFRVFLCDYRERTAPFESHKHDTFEKYRGYCAENVSIDEIHHSGRQNKKHARSQKCPDNTMHHFYDQKPHIFLAINGPRNSTKSTSGQILPFKTW